VALAIAFVAAYPVNRYLIARGKGHAVVHEYHHGGHEQHHEEQHDHDHQEHSHSR
jgi:ABC-type Zn2+ transport system substrate-binding protein/surface adhesin